MNVEAIPYSTFKERLKIVREELAKGNYVEVWDKYIYTASKWGNEVEQLQEDRTIIGKL